MRDSPGSQHVVAWADAAVQLLARIWVGLDLVAGLILLLLVVVGCVAALLSGSMGQPVRTSGTGS